jgi:hypothetical protein
MIGLTTKLLTVTVVLTALLFGTPLRAAPFTWVSSTGTSSGPCAIAQPCPNLFDALGSTDAGGQVSCLNSPGIGEGSIFLDGSATIDCLGVHTGFGGSPQITLPQTGQVFKIRNLTFTGTGGGTPTAIKVIGSGTLILENCVFENFPSLALDIEPTGAFNLVIKNSRVSNNTGGVLIKPAAGGSVTATFDGVTIADNGGGLKTDTTNGAIMVDISNSTFSNSGANGLNVIGGAGGANMVTLKNDVIASSATAGIQASGGTAAVLVSNTLLDSNTTGATSATSGGRILTYGNNNVIGAPGSGFTSSTPLQ